MALDKDGRPIPIEVPPPPDHSGQPTEADVQFMLMAKKADDALRLISDLSQRVNDLEKVTLDRLNEELADFTKRFEDMMGGRMRDVQAQFEALASSYPHTGPDHPHALPPAPPGPRPTPPPEHTHHDSSQGH
jgi:hypothetical protein